MCIMWRLDKMKPGGKKEQLYHKNIYFNSCRNPKELSH